MIRLSNTDFKILKALPRSLNYSEISVKAGFSQPYVSGRIKSMREKFDFVFKVDFWSMSLQPILVVGRYSEDFVKKSAGDGFMYMYSVETAYRGVEKLLFVELIPPRDKANSAVDALGLDVVKLYRKRYEVMWRPDKSELVRLEGGLLVVDIDRLSEVYEQCDEYREAERRIIYPDYIDLLILWKKMEHPFMPLATIGRKLGISQQLVSYHFRHHVLSQWIYNGVRAKILEKTAPTLFVRVNARNHSSALKLLELSMHVPFVQRAFTTYDEPSSVYMFVTIPCDVYVDLLDCVSGIGDVESVEVEALVNTRTRIKGKYPWGNSETPPEDFMVKRRRRHTRK